MHASCVSGYPFGLYFSEDLPKKKCIHLCFLQLNLRTTGFVTQQLLAPGLGAVPFQVLNTGLLALPFLISHHSLFSPCLLVFLFNGLAFIIHLSFLPAVPSPLGLPFYISSHLVLAVSTWLTC